MAFSRVVLRMLAERRRRSVVAACDTPRKSETPGSTATDTPRSTDDDRHRTRGTRDEGGRQPAGLGGRARLARRAVRRRRGLRRDADHDADDRLSHPHLGRPATGHYQPDTAWCREASTSPPRHPVPRGLDLTTSSTPPCTSRTRPRPYRHRARRHQPCRRRSEPRARRPVRLPSSSIT